MLPQHAPATRSRSKASSSAPTISSEKICCATKLLLLSFAPSYQTGLIGGSKLQGQICCTSLFQEQAPWCVLKFACRDMVCLQLANQIGLFFSSTTHCELTFIVPMLFHHSAASSWLGYLPGSVFRERVSGASSLVCTGLNTCEGSLTPTSLQVSWLSLSVSNQYRVESGPLAMTVVDMLLQLLTGIWNS